MTIPSKEEQADMIFKLALHTEKEMLATFRLKYNEVIGSTIEQKRFDDLIKLFHKQGFLQGMKFANDNRNLIK